MPQIYHQSLFSKYIISMFLVDIKRISLPFHPIIHHILVILFGILTHQDACGPFPVCLKEIIMKIMTTLYCMCIIWPPIKPMSSNVHTDTEAKTHGLQLHDGPLQITKKKVQVLSCTEPDRSFLQAKGQVWRRSDISPSLTHPLQRQRLSLVTHSDSDSGSAAWCHPVLPSAVVGQTVFYSISAITTQRQEHIIYNV